MRSYSSVKSSDHSSKRHRFVIESSFNVRTLLPSKSRSGIGDLMHFAYQRVIPNSHVKKKNGNPKGESERIISSSRRDVKSFRVL